MTTSTFGQADFVIITALEKEAQAVIRRLENPQVMRDQQRDIRTYHYGTVAITGTDRAYHVAVVVLPSMGELPAATATTDALNFWNPNFVLMVGIAQDDLDLGDVVVADQVVGYEYGKVKGNRIMPRDRVYPASALLLDRVRNFWDDAWAEQVKATRPTPVGRDKSKRFVGPIASGNKVIASKLFQAQLKERWPKLIAVETEAEGVLAAVFDRPQIRGTLVVRGISDMADKAKDDAWQEYAANAAAAYAIAWLKSGPVDTVETLHASRTSLPRGPVKISLAKLPSTNPDLFGREKELAVLDAAWKNPQANVLSLVAWGGVGKTALVNKWLSQMGADHYRGAERVYGWSFYSQGAAEGRQVSADPFIAAALAWFGDPDPNAGSPWDKGERLAELVKRERTLLILDGLEPLQNPPPVETGCIKDPALVALLRELARQNPGLVIISTRLAVDDLKDCADCAAIQIDLENLSPEAGAVYLAHLGVDGTDAERQAAAKDFGGHALALTLMGSYLKVVHRGDVRKRKEIPRLTDDQRQGAHARRMMEAYERWFAGKPELDILRLMGLFDRPAEGGALDALRKKPAIKGLTERVQKLKDSDWPYAVENLRTVRLLAAADPHEPDTLDCHPLLREHFAERVRTSNPQAWRDAHSRLYEYYKSHAKELPDTIEEMAPLFAAVMHGCQAGKHQEAHDEVYARRIQRMNEYFDIKKLGAFGADLAALSGFFDQPWRKPVDGLTERFKALVLNIAGFDLRALSRLAEATQPLQSGLEADVARKDWKNAAIAANNLGELELTLGDVKQALTFARQSVELADRSSGWEERIMSCIAIADALHQAGSFGEAEAAFREAEEMQKQDQPEFPLLYSVQGYQYCDLLLSQGKYAEVQRRASQTIEIAKRNKWLLDIALDHLSLGRAHTLSLLGREQGEGVTTAAAHLDRAVDGLRQAGEQEFIVPGLLARAEFHRITGALDKAQRDLDEAFSIATRGGMRLFEADCHLEYARWYLAMASAGRDIPAERLYDDARKHLAIAKKMIDEMGYHRRDQDVKELEGRLA